MSHDMQTKLAAAYRHLQRELRPMQPAAAMVRDSDEHAGGMSPAADATHRETRELDPDLTTLFETEAYPGEGFELALAPDPHQLLPAFVTDTGIEPTDVILVSVPQTAQWERLFYSLIRVLSETAVVVTTKHQPDTVHSLLEPTDVVHLDVAPSADRQSETQPRNSCRDLTSLGVAVDEALEESTTQAATGGPVVFGLLALSHLSLYHDRQHVGRFLHEVTGRLREYGFGGLLYAPPNVTATESWTGVTASVDYVLEGRTTDTGLVQARLNGRPHTDGHWRTLGVASHSAQSHTEGVAHGQLDAT